MLILASQACGRTAVGETPQQPTAEPTLPGSPIPMSTEVVPTAPLSYPFEGRNMFFGLTMISRPEDGLVARELGVSWVSLQPLVVWFALEQQPGVYNWAPLDREILYLQSLQVDPTMALFPWNLFGDERLELTALLEEQAAADGYSDLAATFQAFLRHSPEADAWQLYPHDDTLPLWLDFIRAAVARYNGDGVDDMPGLRYPIRNWHLVEEYPFPGFGDAENYVQILIPTYQAVKSEDP
jgi:hypothetical protein